MDSATAAALPRLLADKPFRAALFRGLQGADERKLLKCLQLLQRCLGDGPPGTQTALPHTSSAVAPWGFRTLIDHGATRPLTAACRSVLRVLRRASAPRTLAALLHSTLLDALDAACATDVAAAGTVLRPHNADGAHDAGGSAHSRSNNNNYDDSSDAGRNWEWPPELLLAHAALLLEVRRCLFSVSASAEPPGAALACLSPAGIICPTMLLLRVRLVTATCDAITGVPTASRSGDKPGQDASVCSAARSCRGAAIAGSRRKHGGAHAGPGCSGSS